MFEFIIATIAIIPVTALYLFVTLLFGYMIDDAFLTEEFKKAWSNFTIKKKVIAYVIMAFPVMLYILTTYLIVDLWIIYLTSIL